MSYTCIIPAWNEAARIAKVMNVVLTYEKFSQVIVVDDGSTDETYSTAKKFEKDYPHLKVLSSDTNMGKAAAVQKGIDMAESENIVLVDADLINLSHSMLKKLIAPYSSGEYRMTILDRGGDRRTWLGWTNIQRLLGGERCFRKKDYLEANISPNAGFLLESTLNNYFVKRDFPVLTVFVAELDSSDQLAKHGSWRGFWRYTKTSVKIIFSVGPVNLMKQQIAFEEDMNAIDPTASNIRKLYLRVKNAVALKKELSNSTCKGRSQDIAKKRNLAR